MKYNTNKEIIKLQGGKSVPGKYGNVSEIAQYNLENGTHFYTIDQVEQHKRKANPGFLSKLAQTTVKVPVTPGVSTSVATSLQNIPKVESTVGQELGYATGFLTSPMLLSEIGTYGPLVGGLRLAAGSAGAAGGSYVVGKVGDFADKMIGTNWIGDTGRLLGGFAGFGAGTKSTTPLIRSAAGKGLTLHMPQNTFTNLRGQYFDNKFSKINYNAPLRYVNISEVPVEEFTGKNIEPGTRFFTSELMDTLTGKPVGEMHTALLPNGDHKVAWIQSNRVYGFWKDGKYTTYYPDRGISRGLYNGTVPYTERGLISGWDVLLEPEKTKSVWKHFDYKPLDKGVNLIRQETFVPELENKTILVDKKYPIIGNLKMNPKRDINTPDYLSDTYFGEPMKPGFESDVFESPFGNNVIKIQHGEYVTPEEAIKWSNKRMSDRNKVPFIQKPIKRIGLMIGPTGGYTPVYSQIKLKPLIEKLDLDKIKSIFDQRMIENGWSKTLDDFSYKKDGKHVNFWDLKNNNLGLDENGNLFGFDLDIFKQGGILKVQTKEII